MSKRLTRVLSLVLTLVMFLSVSTPAFAIGGGDMGRDFGRDIGENEIRDFEPAGEIAEEEELDYFQTTVAANGSQVTVEAPMGALPTLAELRAEPVEIEDVREAVESVVEGEANILLAMDISFWLNGIEIEPEEPVRVKISAPELEGRENLTLVHIPDAAEPETVDLIDEGDLSFALGTNEIAFKADSFSVYVVVGDDDTGDYARAEVNFISNGTTIATVYVKNKDTAEEIEKIVYDPGAGTLAAGQTFVGWTETPVADQNEDTQGLTIDEVRTALESRPITEGDTINYYALIFTTINLTYLDEDNVAIAASNIKLYGNDTQGEITADEDYTPHEGSHNFEGWIVQQGKNNIVSAKYNGEEIKDTHGTEENPFPKGTVLTLKGDVVLGVSAPEGHWLVFDENGKGATYNAPQFVKGSDVTKAEYLTMTRYGYTFGGWFTDKECTTAFVFGHPLQENTTIYAKWTAVSSAGYTILIWLQNLDGESYDFKEAVSLSGNTGSIINTVAAQGSGNDRYARVNGTNKQYTGFHLKEFDQNVAIAPEGNAVVNVYYDRNQYTLTFQTARGTTIKTIVALYEQYIGDQFPIVGNNGTTYPTGTRWNPQSNLNVDGQQYFTRDTVVSYIDVMTPGNMTFRYSSDPTGYGYAKRTMNYWIEALPGVQDDPSDPNTTTYKNKVYENRKTVVATYYGVTVEDYIDLPGFEHFEADKYLRDSYYRDTNSNNGTRSTVVNFYYTRKVASINFMDGVYVDGDNKPLEDPPDNQGQLSHKDNIPFQSDLSSYNMGGADYESVKPTLSQYTFEGWYVDSACTQAYTFTTMPEGGITVYAKWRLNQYRVFLRPDVPTSDSSLDWGSDKQQLNFRISSGFQVSAPTGTRAEYEMMGWYDKNGKFFDAKVYTFNDSSDILENYDKTVDMTDDMDIWGKIKSSSPTPEGQETKGYNSDAYDYDKDTGTFTERDRFWITKKVELTAHWRHVTPGSKGIGVLYSLTDTDFTPSVDGITEVRDTTLYLDQATALAMPATKAPEGYKFECWILQKWDGQKFVDIEGEGAKVYPGGEFTIDFEKAHQEILEQANDGTIISATYTMQLRAKFTKNDDVTPTHITWFSNHFDVNGTKIEQADLATDSDRTYTYDAAKGYYFTVVKVGEGEEEHDLGINEAIPVPDYDTYTAAGYKFLGWAKLESSDENTRAAQDPSTLDEDDLFLKWDEENSKYLAKDDDGNWTVEAKKVAADEYMPYEDLYAIWGYEFYVYHSGVEGGALETIAVTRAGTYDLTQHLGGAGINRDGEAANVLYGGYYLEGGFTPPENTNGELDLDAGTGTTAEAPSYPAYDGTNWRWTTAQTEVAGNAITPVAGTTYYIKEVPADLYLRPYLHFTYNRGTNNITTAWLMTDTDDTNYQETGFAKVSKSEGVTVLVSSITVKTANGNNSVTLTSNRLFNANGLLSYLEVVTDGAIQSDVFGSDLLVQYWLTPDGLYVTSAVSRTYSAVPASGAIPRTAITAQNVTTNAAFASQILEKMDDFQVS